MKPLSSIKKALRILQTFTPDQPELGITEISKLQRIHKSSVSRMVGALVSEGFLEKDRLTNKYRLGLKLVDLASSVLNRYDLREYAGPFMEDLVRKIGEIVHLSILDKNEIVYLEKKGEGEALTVGTKIGGRNPAHASSMGKVLLAGLSSEELNELFSRCSLVRCTPFTITKIRDLLMELAKVRKQGFAIDDEESFQGVRCVGAPIYDRSGKVVAAISVTAPKQRMGQGKMKEIRKQVVESAQMISKRLGMIEEERERSKKMIQKGE
jgi:IclR family KDG regulon transcriptional repressor